MSGTMEENGSITLDAKMIEEIVAIASAAKEAKENLKRVLSEKVRETECLIGNESWRWANRSMKDLISTIDYTESIFFVLSSLIKISEEIEKMKTTD